MFHSPNALQMGEADFCGFLCRDFHLHFKSSPNFTTSEWERKGWETDEGIERETGRWDKDRGKREGAVCQRESISSSAGAVSRCRQSGYKQKVFSPLTSSTGPSVGRRHRNAYSPGVTATVCHQSVRLTALPADNASTRAQLRFITEGEKLNNKAWWNTRISTASHLILTCSSMIVVDYTG